MGEFHRDKQTNENMNIANNTPQGLTDDLETELRRWQDAIRDLLCDLTGDDGTKIDGGGCDSGDPLDLTLTEIRQAWQISAKEGGKKF